MTLSATTDWQLQSNATAGMLNGGGFNQGATFGITNATVDTNTGNTSAPILSSASYTFVASDNNAWVFIAAGTSCTKGFYQITAVAGGKATLNAAIGAAVQQGANGKYNTANTVAGIATIGTPTNITVGVDYSQQNTADATQADFASVGSSTTLTSTSAPFKLTHIGNMFHLTTTGTGAHGVVGWYEITAFASTTSVTTDRTTNDGTALAAGTGYIGGALDLTGTLPDSFFESVIGGNNIWIKSDAAYTLGSAVSVASVSATIVNPVFVLGFASLRGDNPTGATRPSINCGAVVLSFGAAWAMKYLIFTGTATQSVVNSSGTTTQWWYCKCTNTSTTAGRGGIRVGGGQVEVMFCEAISQNGPGIFSDVAGCKFVGCYAHDSNIGMQITSSSSMHRCVVASCRTDAVSINSTGNMVIDSCTLYGSEAQNGVGLLLAAATGNTVTVNTIFYGFTTGVSQTTAQAFSNMGAFNDYFNNGTNATNYSLDPSTILTNPSFAGAGQLTGSTATCSGSTLTQTGAFSSVTDNVDFLRIISGSGATVAIYLITSHTADTVTVNNTIGTNATANKVWSIPTGHNYAVGVNMQAQGFPGLYPGSNTTSYLDMGAVQIQQTNPGAAGEKSFSFVA